MENDPSIPILHRRRIPGSLHRLGADGGGVMPAPGKLKLTREDVAAAMELRSQGVSWASVAYLLGKASCSTWRATVMRAELLGFAAWPHA